MNKNILIIRLKSIGDVMFTLPAVNLLRDHYPTAKISFLTSKENTSILSGFRAVDEVIALDRAALRSGNPLRVVPEFCGLLWRLRAGKFSLVVDLQGYGETAWLTRFTGAPDRWGCVYKGRSDWAYTRGFIREEQLHPAEWNLHLLHQAGLKATSIRNDFALPADELKAARDFYQENKLDYTQPTLVLQPFTSSPCKNWPLDNFLAVARYWRQRGVQVIFAGGPADRKPLEPVRRENFCLAAGLPLLVAAGLVQLATLTLGCDSGLGHLGVAQGKQVLMMMRHKNPGACVPFQHPEWAVAPETDDVISSLPVAAVLAETGKILNPLTGNVSC